MGLYLEPNIDKTEWIETNGEELTCLPKDTYMDNGRYIVCHIDNLIFVALGVMYSKKELDYVLRLDDGRVKRWFYVSIEDIKELAHGWESYI